MNKKLKKIAIIILVIAIIMFGASFLIKKAPIKAKEGALSSSNNTSPTTNISPKKATSSSDEFGALLSSIKQISIDTSLFDNKAYKMLRDFPVLLGSDIVGRTNPFAPVGSEGGGAVIGTTVQTIQSGKITSSTAELGAQILLSDTIPSSLIFEYGTTDAFGLMTSPVAITKSTTSLVNVSKLIPETTYFVRAVLVHGSSNIVGNTTTFITNKK